MLTDLNIRETAFGEGNEAVVHVEAEEPVFVLCLRLSMAAQQNNINAKTATLFEKVVEKM